MGLIDGIINMYARAYGLPLLEGKSAAPKPPDYSEALRIQSDHNRETALAQIHAQKFALQQAAMDREMQLAAQLELGLEKLDTKLQVSKMEYLQQMAAEENRHAEKMAEGRAAYARSPEAGFPEPGK